MTRRQQLVLLVAGGAFAAYWFTQSVDPPVAKQIGTTDRPVFLGRVRTRDFVAELRSAVSTRSSFLALKVTRHYVHTQDINRSFLGLTSRAAVVITYSVEYPVGFDLTRLDFRQEEGGVIVVTLDRPQLVASPSVRLLSHDVPARGWLVDEEEALVELQQRVQPLVQRGAAAVAAEPAVVAAAEGALTAFLRAALAARGGPPPPVRLAYR